MGGFYFLVRFINQLNMLSVRKRVRERVKEKELYPRFISKDTARLNIFIFHLKSGWPVGKQSLSFRSTLRQDVL